MLSRLEFSNAGQVCVSPTRFHVQDEAWDRFMRRRGVTAMTEFVQDAAQRGARIEIGGERIGQIGNFFVTKFVAQMD